MGFFFGGGGGGGVHSRGYEGQRAAPCAVQIVVCAKPACRYGVVSVYVHTPEGSATASLL